jgi:hypothetical protein
MKGKGEGMSQTEVQEIWLEVAGMRLHCLTAGQNGSPVVLLHGAGIDSAALSWGVPSGHYQYITASSPPICQAMD